MDNQKRILNKISSDFIKACEENLKIDLELHEIRKSFMKIMNQHPDPNNLLDIIELQNKHNHLSKKQQHNLSFVRKGFNKLDFIKKQQFQLN
jgi:hypothetical protein